MDDNINKKKRIIIADDEKDTLDLLKDFLESEGYEVYTAINGIQLFEILKTVKIDLIFLDIMMNWISGYALCKALKESEDYKKDIPVIFISAKSRPEDIALGFASGGDDYITKPFQLTEILKKLKEHLNE